MSYGPSLSRSCLPTAGGVGSSTPFVAALGSSTPFVAALGGGALLTPAPLHISGVANVVILPAMAGAIFYCADLESIQVPCVSLPNRTLPVNAFSNNNLAIADLRAAAQSSANGGDTLSRSTIGIMDLRTKALGFANGSTYHQQLPVPSPANLSFTVPASCRELFNIPKLATLTENKPLGHQCNVHETPERTKRQDTMQAQHGPTQKTQNDTPKSLSKPHVSKATGKPRKRNLDSDAVKLLQVLILHSGSAMCS